MYAVIIVAGGTGSRMDSGIPKQFILLNQKPIIVYSIEKFLQFNANTQIIVSIHANYFNLFNEIKAQYNLQVDVVTGGETRYQSVKNALHVLKENVTVVAVHDAARPLVSLQTIEKTVAAAEQHGVAIPIIDMNESLREVNDTSSKAVDRTRFKIVQTPQCFKKDILLSAYNMPYSPLFTDDASVAEKLGHSIYLTEGNIENIKITYPQDLILAQLLLK